MKKIVEFMNENLMSFRECFTRNRSFQWFVIVIIGFILSGESNGVTSFVRELGLNPKHYESLLHFFRSNAWELKEIRLTWIKMVEMNTSILMFKGYKILIGDGVKQAKEGKKMPGVKKLHQESENSSKAKYIFGHMYGVVSVLVGHREKQFALPITASVQDGVAMIRQYKDSSKASLTHVEQLVMQAGNVAKAMGKCILLLDSYFLSVPALRMASEFIDDSGEALIELVTKAKMSCSAYTDPPKYSGKGRPRKKGDKIKIKDLFRSAILDFNEAELYLYGKFQTVSYYSMDLLWGIKLYKKLRFVLVISQNGAKSIFVSTSLQLTPLEIIELYSYRFKIEISFKVLKHTLFGFCYHFWSSYMPILNRYHKDLNQKALEAVSDTQAKTKILATLKAIEAFVMCSCIACGFLQMISLKFSDSAYVLSNLRWMRTTTNKFVSESSVAYFLRKNFLRFIHKYSNFAIIQIILSKQFDPAEEFDQSA